MSVTSHVTSSLSTCKAAIPLAIIQILLTPNSNLHGRGHGACYVVCFTRVITTVIWDNVFNVKSTFVTYSPTDLGCCYF